MRAGVVPICWAIMKRAPAACSAVVILMTLGGCARSHLARPPVTQPDEPDVAIPAVPSSEGESIADAALAFVGVPYRNGGSDPAGFDCSGFVQYVFAGRGITLPRGVDGQFHAGRPVGADQIDAGDLVFFTTTGRGASHVGIAVGQDAFVHAPSSAGRIRVERLSAPYWAQRFVGARRVLAGPPLTPR
jgi:cell wall-associated NlpC family hydrolase